MISIEQAVNAADERKRAAYSLEAGGAAFTVGSPERDRRLFVGLDVDYDELSELATRAGYLFWAGTQALPVPPMMTAAWVEGVLVGMLAVSLDPERSE